MFIMYLALLDKDKKDLIWAFKNGCDMISASFVNSEEDVKALRKLMKDYNISMKKL